MSNNKSNKNTAAAPSQHQVDESETTGLRELEAAFAMINAANLEAGMEKAGLVKEHADVVDAIRQLLDSFRQRLAEPQGTSTTRAPAIFSSATLPPHLRGPQGTSNTRSAVPAPVLPPDPRRDARPAFLREPRPSFGEEPMPRVPRDSMAAARDALRARREPEHLNVAPPAAAAQPRPSTSLRHVDNNEKGPSYRERRDEELKRLFASQKARYMAGERIKLSEACPKMLRYMRRHPPGPQP